MKKKLLVFIGVVATLLVVGYTAVANGEANERVQKKWTFNEEQVKQIIVAGAQQNIEVEIIETDSLDTTVELVGTISESERDRIEKAVVKDGKLVLDFAKHGIQLMVTTNDKEALKLRITTNLKQPFKEVTIDMLMGNVLVKVPESYQGDYQVTVSGKEGQILGVPETTKEMASVLKVLTSDNIEITK